MTDPAIPPPPPPPPRPGTGIHGYAGAFPRPGDEADPYLRTADRGLAWTGFALALTACVPFLPLVGAVLGVVALLRRRFRRIWVPIVGVVAGLGITAVQAALAPAVIEAMNDSSRPDERKGPAKAVALEVGNCFDNSGLASAPSGSKQDSIKDVALRPCAEPHQFQVFATIDLETARYPGAKAILERSTECGPAFRSFIGGWANPEELRLYLIYPTRQSWYLSDDHEITCVVGDPAGPRLTHSLEGIGRS